MKHTQTKKLVLSALFLALAYTLPFLTGQIKAFGAMLCPMHLPVLLCGFICGWRWGAAVGLTAPLFRSLTIGMPKLFPSAICMTFELATYGIMAGIIYRILPKKKKYIYLTLLLAMIAGRLVWGAAMFSCVGASGGSFGISAFLAGAFTNAVPGIIAQIILIPPVVIFANKN